MNSFVFSFIKCGFFKRLHEVVVCVLPEIFDWPQRSVQTLLTINFNHMAAVQKFIMKIRVSFCTQEIIFRCSHPEVFWKIAILKNSIKFLSKYLPYRVQLQLYDERTSWQVFSWKFSKIFRVNLSGCFNSFMMVVPFALQISELASIW